MDQRRLKRDARADVLPWQAALMVMCVTAAGLLHEHPGAMRPVMASLQAAQLRSGVAHAVQPAGVLNVALWLRR